MQRRALGSGGLEVSEQGLGCMGMTFAYGPADEKEAIATVHRAIDLGVTLFDTSDMYGPLTNEVLLGKAIAGRRDGIAISSKVGNEISSEGNLTGKVNCSPDYIRRAIDASLLRLGTDHLDLYYLHRIDPQVPVEESIGALAELVRSGKVNHIGVSEAAATTIRRADAVHPLAAVQTEYSLVTRDVEHNGVLATTRELGIGFVAYSPISRGLLTGVKLDPNSLAERDFRRQAPRFEPGNLAANEVLVARMTAIADRLDVTVAQLALAWVLAQGDDIVAIPGTKRRSYLEENLGAGSIVLDAGTLAELDEIFPYGATRGERYAAPSLALLNG